MAQGRRPTPDQKRAVLNDFRKGYNRAQVASRHHLDRGTIARILKEARGH